MARRQKSGHQPQHLATDVRRDGAYTIFNVPAADIPPDMWDLLKLGVGGYVVGRSAEKGIKAWKE